MLAKMGSASQPSLAQPAAQSSRAGRAAHDDDSTTTELNGPRLQKKGTAGKARRTTTCYDLHRTPGHHVEICQSRDLKQGCLSAVVGPPGKVALDDIRGGTQNTFDEGPHEKSLEYCTKVY